MLDRKLILNLAPTGMVPRKSDNASVPITPDEIAEECRRCRDAGVSIVHLHARDDDGTPTHRRERFAEIVGRVRALAPELVVCVTTSGRTFRTLEERAQSIELEGDLRPEMASLTLGSMNFPKQASVNAPDVIQGLASRMAERGIVPELEIFDFGMLDYGRYLIERGLLRPPFYANLLLGSLGTLAATPFHLAALAKELPEGFTWAAAGIGRYQLPMNAMAVTMGGHVRVGLEDNLFMDAGKTDPATNVRLVERVVGVARSVGREIASPAEARAMIGLPARG